MQFFGSFAEVAGLESTLNIEHRLARFECRFRRRKDSIAPDVSSGLGDSTAWTPDLPVLADRQVQPPDLGGVTQSPRASNDTPPLA